MKANGVRRPSGIKIILSVALLCCMTAAARNAQAYQNDRPVTEDGLIRLLSSNITPSDIIRLIEARGVSFQLTPAFEEEIRGAGKHLGRRDLANLLAAINNNFRPPKVTPFRITYRLLKGHAVDLLLDGRIDKRWDSELSGKVFIVRNDVLSTLTYLMRTFSAEFHTTQFYKEQAVEGEDVYRDRRLARLYKRTGKRLFVGSVGEALKGELADNDEPNAIIHIANVHQFIVSLSNPEEPWRIYSINTVQSSRRTADGSGLMPLFTFRKVADRHDLNSLPPSPLKEFYLHVTGKYMPPDFGFAELYQNPGSCGDSGEEVEPSSVYFFGPLLSLNVAVVENVSSEPFSVGRFLTKENNSDRLRGRDEDQAVIGAQPLQKQFLFSPGVLRPGEKLVIPLELSLTIEENYLLDAEWGERYEWYADALARVRADGGAGFRVPDRQTDQIVSADVIERIMNRPPIKFSAREYLYGPSISIESLEVNQYGYLVRRFDPSKLLITSAGDLEGGSCPYIYTYSIANKSWVSEGVILYGNSSKLRESTDEVLLKRFNGQVLIMEKDPEDSYIDMIQIRAFTDDGKETILRPVNRGLLAADGEYIKLKQGEQLIVDFDMPQGFAAHKFVLRASGYYIPYKVQVNHLSRRPMAMRKIPKQSRHSK